MNKGLDLIERQQPEIIDGFPTGNIYIGVTEEELAELEKELKELDKIKARLFVVNMKLNSKREECVEYMIHTDEDDYVHEASETEIRCIDWFREMLKEVLL